MGFLSPNKAIAYSLFIGPISDHVGLKPLLLLPLLGAAIDDALFIGKNTPILSMCAENAQRYNIVGSKCIGDNIQL